MASCLPQTYITMLQDFLQGLTAHARAIHLLLSRREVRRLAATPFIINLILFLVAVPLAVFWAFTFVGEIGAGETGIARAGIAVLQVVAGLVVIGGAVLLFGVIGGAIAGPFSGPLSQRVESIERDRRGLPQVQIPERGMLADIWRGLVYAIGRLIIFLLVYPLIFLLQFIPGAGQILFTILALLYSAFVLSVDFSDPILDRKLDTFREKLRYILDRKARSLGFGLGCVILLLVPIVNLVMIPVCVVAGTVVWVEGSARG